MANINVFSGFVLLKLCVLLQQLAGQLACHTNVTDPLERSGIQSSAIRSGALFQNLGALLLELGRAIMTLRMGQAPVDAMVNAGPSVFVSSTGPNPIMVQPLPFQPGASFGSIPVGTVQHGSGLAAGSVGSGFLPRNIDIRIRTGSVFPRRETTGSQPLGQGAPGSSNTVNSGQQDAAGFDSNSQSREPQVRAIPIRTVVAAVPASVGRGSDSSQSSIGILYPVLARVQQVTTGNPNGTLASQALDQHYGPDGNTEQPVPDSSTRQLNAGVTGENGISSSAAELLSGQGGQGFSAQIQNGLEQLLRTIFPGEQAFSENANPSGPVLVQSHTEATQDEAAAASTASEEGILLSNILRQLLPMITENSGVESNLPSTPGAYSVETQDDENTEEGGSSCHLRSPRSPQSSKRQRRE